LAEAEGRDIEADSLFSKFGNGKDKAVWAGKSNSLTVYCVEINSILIGAVDIGGIQYSSSLEWEEVAA
jgi:hypothetical protein